MVSGWEKAPGYGGGSPGGHEVLIGVIVLLVMLVMLAYAFA
jgi:hypothetical protein